MRAKSSPYAILGMLSIQPMSGYDIRKEIATSTAHFWHEGYGQIYPALRRLEADGLVEQRRAEKGSRPERNVFSLTAKGRAQLQDWLAQTPKTQTPRSELLLKLFFGRLARDEALERHVVAFRNQHQEALSTYHKLESELRKTQARHPDLPFWLMTASYGRHISRALVKWSEETLCALAQTERTETSGRKRRMR